MRPMAFQTPSVRSAALRSKALSFETAISTRVEVGAVGWQIAQFGADRLDHLVHSRPLVARKIVHHGDVAVAQFGHEHLGDIGLEGIAIDRAVQNPRRDEATRRKRPNEKSLFSSGRAARQP